MAQTALGILARKKKKLPALTGNQLVQKLGLSPAELPIEAADVQGLVFRGYGALRECRYVLLQVHEPERGRAWLGALAERVAPGVPAAGDAAVHVAFTHPGLAALGLHEDALAGFSREFIAGMTGPHRSRFLGDEGDSAPERWQWGGPNNPTVHMLLILLADGAARLEELMAEMRRGWTDAGCVEILTLHTNPELIGREHFGFADGISQPAIDGYHPAPSALHLVKPGEFVLGYVNEYGQYTGRPLLDAARDRFGLLPLDVQGSPRRDLGKNGTYLVFRQLRQDVPGFEATLDALTRNPDGSSNSRARDRLAAQMVGRWPSGASLIDAPYGDDASKARHNEFRYHDEDPHGLKCPIGAHVRRANPRDALAPDPGSERSLSINRRHRLLRRGRTYGPAHDGGDGSAAERGLMFIALNANISRQFEFVQHSWLGDPRFNGLYGESDPIVGTLADNRFEVPGDPLRLRCTGLPRFVTVAGGGYFFLPGIRALRFLSRMTP